VELDCCSPSAAILFFAIFASTEKTIRQKNQSKNSKGFYMLAFSILLAWYAESGDHTPSEPPPFYFCYIILVVAIVGFLIYGFFTRKK
jgi:hypothetical protein